MQFPNFPNCRATSLILNGPSIRRLIRSPHGSPIVEIEPLRFHPIRFRNGRARAAS